MIYKAKCPTRKTRLIAEIILDVLPVVKLRLAVRTKDGRILTVVDTIACAGEGLASAEYPELGWVSVYKSGNGWMLTCTGYVVGRVRMKPCLMERRAENLLSALFLKGVGEPDAPVIRRGVMFLDFDHKACNRHVKAMKDTSSMRFPAKINVDAWTASGSPELHAPMVKALEVVDQGASVATVPRKVKYPNLCGWVTDISDLNQIQSAKQCGTAILRLKILDGMTADDVKRKIRDLIHVGAANWGRDFTLEVIVPNVQAESMIRFVTQETVAARVAVKAWGLEKAYARNAVVFAITEHYAHPRNFRGPVYVRWREVSKLNALRVALLRCAVTMKPQSGAHIITNPEHAKVAGLEYILATQNSGRLCG